MKVYSDDKKEEFEFLQSGILVHWNFVEKTEDGKASWEYDEVKIELTDTKDQIISKLQDAGYEEDKETFADRIIDFRNASNL